MVPGRASAVVAEGSATRHLVLSGASSSWKPAPGARHAMSRAGGPPVQARVKEMFRGDQSGLSADVPLRIRRQGKPYCGDPAPLRNGAFSIGNRAPTVLPAGEGQEKGRRV